MIFALYLEHFLIDMHHTLDNGSLGATANDLNLLVGDCDLDFMVE